MNESITPNQSKDVREKLIDIYKSRRNTLQQVSKHNINPKLEKLKEMIIRGFEKDPDSRAIVFAKTLSLVQKLKNWMEETPELKRLNLNPETVTGARSSADKGGMTKTQQMEVLECFKEGSGKIIIATSVAEEGLDIQKCNLVIRYDHVTNEIAMVQSRGRARAANSQFLVVSGDDSNSAKKEQMNLSRELMMKQAIKRLEETDSKIFNDKVIERQKNAKLYRDAEKKRRDGRIIRDSEFELRCFQCNTLACFSTDIRTIKQCQYTVIEDSFREAYFTRPHPEPSQIGSGNEFMKTNKIFCKNNCGYDWGIEAIFRNISFPLIKIQSFVIEDADGKKTTVKKWKNVPFPIHEISDDDLRQRFEAASGNNMETDSEDDAN